MQSSNNQFVKCLIVLIIFCCVIDYCVTIYTFFTKKLTESCVMILFLTLLFENKYSEKFHFNQFFFVFRINTNKKILCK